MIPKTEQLSNKKNDKFQQRIKDCRCKIDNGLVGQALELAKEAVCKDILFHKPQLDVSPFRGLGSVENWLQQFPEGPM